MEELLSQVLDETEETLVEQFFHHEKMREAVKKVLFIPLYSHGTLKKGRKVSANVNWLLNSLNNTNENLGSVIRAKIEAAQMIEDGFKLLSKIKKIDAKVVDSKNLAR